MADFPTFPASRDYVMDLCSRRAFDLPTVETERRAFDEHPLFDHESREDAKMHESWYASVQNDLSLPSLCYQSEVVAHLSEERRVLRSSTLGAGEIDARRSLSLGRPRAYSADGADFWSHGLNEYNYNSETVLKSDILGSTYPRYTKPRSAVDGAWNYFPLHVAAASSDWSLFRLYASQGHSVLRESFEGSFPFDEWYRSLWKGRTLAENRSIENAIFRKKQLKNRYATMLCNEHEPPLHTSVHMMDLPILSNGAAFDFSPAVIRLSLPSYFQDTRPTGDADWDALAFPVPGPVLSY